MVKKNLTVYSCALKTHSQRMQDAAMQDALSEWLQLAYKSQILAKGTQNFCIKGHSTLIFEKILPTELKFPKYMEICILQEVLTLAFMS